MTHCMKILSHPIKHSDLTNMLASYRGEIIKAVVEPRCTEPLCAEADY